MPSELIKKTMIVLMLGLLTASAFFIRLENFKNSKIRSIDEIVYYRMGKQIIEEGLSGYNTIPYGKEMAAAGRPLPDYFFQPLFKYPPLFTLLISLSIRVFGRTLLSAEYIPLLFGVLTIPLIYILGSFVFNRNVGALSAVFLWMDPVSIICSQKVWLDAPLAFFTVLSIMFFVIGIKKDRHAFFLAGGLACGLATLIKYPGILCVVIFALYAVIYDRNLFKNRNFLSGLLLPFLILIPWIIWNFQVFGKGFILLQIGLHSSAAHQKEILGKLILICVGAVIAYFMYRIGKRKNIQFRFWRDYTEEEQMRLRKVCGIAFFIILSKYLVRALQPEHLPVTGWASGMFYNHPFIFYFGRLIEFSLIYLLAYASFFVKENYQNKGRSALKIAVGILFAFYIFFGNFQSRYILAIIPLLYILAANMLCLICKELFLTPPSLQKRLLRLTFLLAVSYVVIKTNFINLAISFPNDLCYF